MIKFKIKRLNAKKIKTTRKLLGISQSVFSELLGVSTSTVQDWEQGRRIPSNIACRFIEEIMYDIAYWRNRLK